jgi:hypothetical protein
MVTIDAPLGNDDAPIEVVEAQPIRVVSGAASTLMPQGGTCFDLVVHNLGPTEPGGPTLGEAVQAPGSLSAVDPRVIELGLLGYPDVLSPPVSRRQVDGSAEHACLQVVTWTGCCRRQWAWLAGLHLIYVR